MIELGVLGNVDDIDDPTMRFYALIGLCISTSAEIEHRLFDCYWAAVAGLDHKSAVEMFNKQLKFSYRRALAEQAVRAALTNPTALGIWDEIISEVQSVCGPDGARNLVGHNPLRYNVYEDRSGESAPFVIELAVNQNFNAVLAGKRRPEKHTFKTLRGYAYALLGAETRLLDFFQRYLSMRKQHQ
jgi:hypothetical protein